MFYAMDIPHINSLTTYSFQRKKFIDPCKQKRIQLAKKNLKTFYIFIRLRTQANTLLRFQSLPKLTFLHVISCVAEHKKREDKIKLPAHLIFAHYHGY